MANDNDNVKYLILTEDELLALGYSILFTTTGMGISATKSYFWGTDDNASEDFMTNDEALKSASIDVFSKHELHRCDNCGKLHNEQTLLAAKDLSMRTDPGGVVPSGECEDCGSLCYPIVPEFTTDKNAKVDGSMTDEGYVASGGNKCPFCGSDDIESTEQAQVDSGGASQQVQCNACNASWHDIYKLVGFEKID